jgi:hypothetical protein
MCIKKKLIALLKSLTNISLTSNKPDEKLMATGLKKKLNHLNLFCY